VNRERQSEAFLPFKLNERGLAQPLSRFMAMKESLQQAVASFAVDEVSLPYAAPVRPSTNSRPKKPIRRVAIFF
jgi:hypothetical protein